MADNGACSIVPVRKVLMTADAVGGVWQYSLDLISHLTERGINVHLATMGPRLQPSQLKSLTAFAGVTVSQSDYKLEWMQDPWDDVDAAGAWLLELAARFQPDVVHLNGYAHAALPWKIPVLTVAHSCVCSWWLAVHGVGAPNKEWSEYRDRVSAGLRAAGAVVAPSAFMADALTEQYGLGSHIEVIYNFSDAPVYSGGEKESFFLAAGRAWDSGKNLQMLDTVSHRLPWPLRVAASLEREALLAEMQRASIYVHPALYEPFGLSVLEAARAQCCLVLADIPSLRELWDGAAVFVDPRQPDKCAETLIRLSGDRTACESWGHLARVHAARYSATTAVERYCRIYQSLANSGKRGARKDAAA